MKASIRPLVRSFLGIVPVCVGAVLSAAAPLVEHPQPYLLPVGSSALALYGMNLGAQADPIRNFVGTNPNENLVFDGGIGVRYTNSSGQQVDSGIGLYAGVNQASTNGLTIRYLGGASAADVTLTLANFGLTADSAFFDPTKVAPEIIIGSGLFHYLLDAVQIFPYMHFEGTVPDNIGGNPVDLWTVNMADLLLQDGINNPVLRTLPINDVVLAASRNPIENVAPLIGPSYFFVASTVPEPGSAILLVSAMGAFFIPRTRRSSRRL